MNPITKNLISAASLILTNMLFSKDKKRGALIGLGVATIFFIVKTAIDYYAELKMWMAINPNHFF